MTNIYLHLRKLQVLKIKDEIIRQFDLPKSFGEVPTQKSEPTKVPANVQAPEVPPQGLPSEQLARGLTEQVPTSNVTVSGV